MCVDELTAVVGVDAHDGNANAAVISPEVANTHFYALLPYRGFRSSR